MVQNCTDSLAVLSHMNSSIGQTHRDNTAYCFDNQYHVSYSVCYQNHMIPLLKLEKTCVDSLKSLGIAFRMSIKGINLVNTRNLATVTGTTESIKNKR